MGTCPAKQILLAKGIVILEKIKTWTNLSKSRNGDGGSCSPGVAQATNIMRSQTIPHILYFKNIEVN